ncbi:hypothetical protein Bca52824_061907 [Brassica carinata]|uniref:Uncharacterized protein n=1 Tax=Brassica carinata TaxID=52824 RepID=A0A8X7QBX3_BRACI|nr:hypothetical protein Bca52824_061907 [Brassica carinata]
MEERWRRRFPSKRHVEVSRGKLVLTDLSLNRHRPWSPTSRGPPEQTTKAENLSGKEVTGEREASAGVEKADAGEPQLHRRQRADEEMAPR